MAPGTAAYAQAAPSNMNHEAAASYAPHAMPNESGALYHPGQSQVLRYEQPIKKYDRGFIASNGNHVSETARVQKPAHKKNYAANSYSIHAHPQVAQNSFTFKITKANQGKSAFQGPPDALIFCHYRNSHEETLGKRKRSQ
jgi:hypothetical protein